MRNVQLLFLLITVSLSGPVFAQGRIAVLPLDETDGSQTVATRMAELLTSGGRDVVFGDPVFKRVQEHRVEPDADVASEFAGVSEQIAAGINQFFYAGHTESLKILAPVIQKGIQHFDYVSTRPDLVAQLYEAALIMVRAYGGAKRPEDMRTSADLLARYFPMMSPNLKNSPPDILALMKETKAEILEAPGARLGIEPRHPSECRRYLNGTQIKEGAYPVAPDIDVFLYIECDGQRSPVWRVRVPAGSSVVVPISMDTFDSLIMTDDSFESRRRAEEVMAAVAFWGGFEEIVAMRQPETMNTAPTLFGHLKQGRVTWTETRDVPAFVGYVEQTFAVNVAGANGAAPEEPSEPWDWPSVAMVGGGLVAAGVGGLLVYLGSVEATSIRCSGYSTDRPSAEECDGVDDLGTLSEDEFDSKISSANLYRVGGFSLIGAGIGLTGWGIYRLIWSGDPEMATRYSPTSDGFVWRFE